MYALSAKSTESPYRRLAESQGVVRPFEILVAMRPESRRVIAEVLGCNLTTDDPEAQAWRLINQNLRGLQARTHSLPEQLTPFSRNNNWWEIVTRTAQRCGLQFYPGLKDQEVERLLFEHLAETFVERHLPRDVEAVDALAEQIPELDEAIRSLRLSRNGTRTVLTALVLATVRADEGLREGAKTVAEWIRKSIRWSWSVSITEGLRILQRGLTEIYSTWMSRGLGDRGKGNLSKVSAALAAIYLQDLIDRTLEEVEMTGP